MIPTLSESREPAESVDLDHNAIGGVLIPSMVAEQSWEFEAGEMSAASTRASMSPALLVPVEPAAVEVGCGQAPEVNSDSVMASFGRPAMKNPPTSRGMTLAGYLLGTGGTYPSNSLPANSPFPQQGFSQSLFDVATLGFCARCFVSAGFLLFVFWVF